MLRGEFARDGEDRVEVSGLEKRKLFLLEIEHSVPEVLNTLYDDVFTPFRQILPLSLEILNYERVVLDTWDKKDNGRTLGVLNEALAAMTKQGQKFSLRIES